MSTATVAALVVALAAASTPAGRNTRLESFASAQSVRIDAGRTEELARRHVL